MLTFKDLRKTSIFLYLIVFFLSSCSFKEKSVSFHDWQLDIKDKAIKQGVSEQTFDQAFVDVKPKIQFNKIDQKQYKRKQSFDEYYNNHVNNSRINKARKLLKENQDLLNQVEQKFNVPKQYILALWGIETDYGRQTGNFYVIESLANLAYNSRRKDFFEYELINALKMIDSNSIEIEDFYGSWAGASGQCQFIPSSYYKYGYDGDNDGDIDIWDNYNDILSSIANYLATLNWDKNLPWGYKVEYDNNLVKSNESLDLKILVNKGLAKKNGENFTEHELTQKVKIITLDNELFITFNNFDILWDWNHSNYFAATVGKFAEKI
jgi:membrane-bound lytic murein transglycosylase B